MPYFPQDIYPLGSGVPEDPIEDRRSSSTVNAGDGRAARIRVKNRRKMYLDRHPEYFSPSLELAGLLVYMCLPTSLLSTDVRIQTHFSMIAVSDASRAPQSGKRKAGKKAIPAF
jgi:hypothetical protein